MSAERQVNNRLLTDAGGQANVGFGRRPVLGHCGLWKRGARRTAIGQDRPHETSENQLTQ